MFRRDFAGNRTLRVGSLVTMVFSLVMSVLILYVIPIACSFVGSIQLLILALLFLGAGAAFSFERLMVWRHKRLVGQH